MKKKYCYTGANRGLGLFLAEKFAQEGHNMFCYQEKN